ncbi:MAG TPA: AMP-binding protein, partial [Longimicrobium sp.]|nr:AMP-binding protein [Longimicrobium sp.]
MTQLLHSLVSEAARRDGARLAVAGDPPAAYYELERRIGDFADALREAGAEGARVGLLLPNVPAFPVAFFGALRAGAGAVMLNPLYSPRELGEYLKDSGAAAVVTIEAYEHLLPSSVPRVELDPSDGSIENDFSAPIDGHGDHPSLRIGGDREAAIIYTSAQDGWARGARLTHRSLIANLRGVHEAMQMRPEDRVLAVAPFVHSFGLTVTLNAPLAAGATVVPVERFHPLRTLDALEQSGATVLAGVPAMFLGLIAAAEKRGTPSHALRIAICGGAPLPREVARRWEETFGLPLREGYGLTEASPVCLFNRVDRPNRPGTLGYPFPGVDVTIRGAQGASLPAGETGEICVEGANLFAGYLGEEGRDPA